MSKAKLIEIALSQVGYQEGAGNANKYGAWYGMNYQPWCAIFVSWCAAQAGVPLDIMPRFSGCTTMMSWYRSKNRFQGGEHTPQAGDLILFDWDGSGDADHVGIVIAVAGNRVYAVEGNSSEGSGGEGVYKRERILGDRVIRGYCCPDYGALSQADHLYPLLRQGDSGERVVYLQERLNFCRQRLGLSYDRLDEDGIFGPKTYGAVRAFQSARKIETDGIVGEITWTALDWQYGDINEDGRADASDALGVLQGAAGKILLTEEQKSTGDMNADGMVDASDALRILQHGVDSPES